MSVRQVLRTFRQLLVLAFRASPWRAVYCFLPIVPFLTIVSFVALRGVLTAMTRGDSVGMAVAVSAYFVTLASQLVVSTHTYRTRFKIMDLIRLEYDQRVMAAVLAPGESAYLERPDYLDHLEVVRRGTGDITGTAFLLGALTDQGLGWVLSVAFVATIDPKLVLVGLAGLPVVFLTTRSQRRLDACRLEHANASRRAAHFYDLGTLWNYAKETRVSGLQDELFDRHDRDFKAWDRALLSAELRVAAVRIVGWLIAAALLVYGGFVVTDGVRDGTLTYADLFIVLALMPLAIGQVTGLGGQVANLRHALHVVDCLIWLEDVGRSSASLQRGAVKVSDDGLSEGIRLDHVGFRYPEATHPALDDVSVTLPAGSVVALVGDNGAGKSTLVKLLLGLDRPTEGRILVDGIDLADADLASWRSRTTACQQDYLNIELTAQRSVGVGDLARLDDASAAITAYGRAGATSLLESLPNGLDTQLGKRSRAKGVDLSTGQWQKVATSRAMMRDTPLLVVLDEPTSALDPFAEAALFEQYAAHAHASAQAAGTVTVLVTFRFSTVHIADLIVVLDSGRVREVGTHRELLASGGLYAELYELQARHYAV